MSNTLDALRNYQVWALTRAPTALLIPSTRTAFAWLASNPFDTMCVVGYQGRPDMETPVCLVERLQRDPSCIPQQTIIFTDQLASARDATVPVRRGGNLRFLSPLEVILNQQHACALYAVNDGALVYLRSQAPIQAIAKFVTEHLDAAENLGPDWLMREHQIERTPDYRRSQRRRFIRSVQSSLLGMTTIPNQQDLDTKLHELATWYAN